MHQRPFDVQIDIIRVYDAHLHCEPIQKPVLNPANFSRLQLIELAMQAEQERLALQSTVAAIQPKADALDRIATQSSGTLNLTNAAKTLQVNPKALIQHLSANRWIYRWAGGKNWTAYQDCQSPSKSYQASTSNFFQLNERLRGSDWPFCVA